MVYLEYVLWSFFIIAPIYIFLTHEKEKQQVEQKQRSLMSVYRSTMLLIWSPTLVLTVLLWQGHVEVAAVGFKWQWELANQLGMLAVIGSIIYCCWSVVSYRHDEQTKAALAKQFKGYEYFIPKTKKELHMFNWGVSTSAGICEEILFRGYLLALFSAYMPIYLAVILSSIAFGLPHIYQGIKGVFRTGFMGLIFALIYLATDSLLVPILLHIIFDVYGGWLTYVVLVDDKGQIPAEPSTNQ